jgi:methionyl-tRNA synthetase
MTNRFRDAVVPAAGADESFESELKTLWESSREESLRLNAEFQFHMGLDRAFTFIRAINRYAEQRAPWKLGKSEDSADQQALSTTLATMAESLRLAVPRVEPVMPETADKVRALLGATVSGTWHEQLRWGDRLAGAKVGETAILFPRPEKA